MSVKLYLPRSMSAVTKGTILVEVEGETAGECLSSLVGIFPGIEKQLFYSGLGEALATEGKLRSKIRIMVNGEHIDTEVMPVKVKSGDKIEIRIDGR